MTKYQRSLLVRHLSPENKDAARDHADRLLTGGNVDTAVFAIYDQDARSVVTAASATAVQTVEDPGVFAVNDFVESIGAAGVREANQIDAIDITAGTITLDQAPATTPPKGSTVRKIFGPDPDQYVAMTEGGNATKRQGEEDWWWRAIASFAVYGADLVIGTNFEVRSYIEGSAAGALAVDSFCGTIVDDCA